MVIDNLKTLEKLMKLCRRQGIESITVDGLTFKIDLSHTNEKPKDVLNDTPDIPSFAPPGITSQTQVDKIETQGQPTAEELLFWSAEGHQ